MMANNEFASFTEEPNMNKRYPFENRKTAFTLMELLVVISIISMLVMIMTTGLHKVMKSAKALKQKSVLHSLDVGLEFFHEENDGYPQSSVESRNGSPPLICGAQHLAEALLGRDQHGFDPVSKWYAPDQDPSVKEYENDPTSLNRRRKLYVDLKSGSAVVLLEQLYDGYSGPVYSSSGDGMILAPVITDIFRHRQVQLLDGTRMFVGNPILYYKAKEASKDFDWDRLRTTPADEPRLIYNYADNEEIISLGPVKDPVNSKHRFSISEPYTYQDQSGAQQTGTGRQRFYHTITDPSVQNFRRPYNPQTFILISAGYDGIFGTKDDVSNFNY